MPSVLGQEDGTNRHQSDGLLLSARRNAQGALVQWWQSIITILSPCCGARWCTVCSGKLAKFYSCRLSEGK